LAQSSKEAFLTENQLYLNEFLIKYLKIIFKYRATNSKKAGVLHPISIFQTCKSPKNILPKPDSLWVFHSPILQQQYDHAQDFRPQMISLENRSCVHQVVQNPAIIGISFSLGYLC